MRTESIAVLRWVPSEVLAEGEDAVVALLEEALASAATGAGITPAGMVEIRPADPDRYPHVKAARPDDDPGAVLHLAELHLGGPD